MNLWRLYWLVDIISTVHEEFCFCWLFREKDEKVKSLWKEIILFVGHFLIVEILTYLNIEATLKILFSVLYFTVLATFVYNTPRSLNCVKIFIAQIAMLFSELITLLIFSMKGIPTMVIVDGVEFAPIHMYICTKAILVLLIIAAKILFNHFHHQFLSWKDAMPFLIMEIATGFLLGELTWELAGRQSRYASLVFVLGTVMFIFSFGYYMVLNAQNMILIANKKLEKQKLEEMEKQHVYYEEKLTEQERVRSIYHDMKNHLLILGAKSTTGEDSKEILKAIQSQIEEYENYYHTGSAFLDIIIRDKARIAKQKGIDFNAVLHFEQGSFISPLDISTIFGNALDNAIEASMKLPMSERLITVKAMQIRDMLSVLIENNCVPGASYSGKTNKEDNFLHGFGIKNIEKAVEKHDGKCVVSSEKGVFSMKIIIPIP